MTSFVCPYSLANPCSWQTNVGKRMALGEVLQLARQPRYWQKVELQARQRPSQHVPFSLNMDSAFKRQLELHCAGATVIHAGPYSDLEVPSTMEPLKDELISKWVAPFYMWGIRSPDEFIAAYAPIRSEMTVELCRALLVSLNWRPRIAAAYFAAIEEFHELEEHLGRLFLRSDVCYSGQGYALALALFNTPGSIEFVKKYLDHYLGRKDLWFDQPDAMAALHFTDSLNGTSNFAAYLPLWQEFVSDKPHADLQPALDQFRTDLNNIDCIRRRSAKTK